MPSLGDPARASWPGVVLLGVLAVRVVGAARACPSLLLYLGIGVLLGESVLGIQFSDAALTESLGLAALVLILVEGGLTTRWPAVRPSLGVGIALSTVAVVVSIGGRRASRLHLLLGLDWRTAFLWGAVLSSTDAAAVFSVLRGVGVSRRLAGALELESGLNDAPVVLAVVAAGLRRPRSPGRPRCWWSTSWSSGRCSGSLLGLRRGVGAAPGRAAVHRALPAGRDRGVRARLLHRPVRARVRAAGHLRRRAGAGQLRPAAPRRRPLVRRGHRLAGPDRAVRAARALRLAVAAARRGGPGAGRGAGAGAAGAAAVGAGRGAAVPGAVARAGVPVLVGAARRGADRARADRADRGRARRASSWSTSCSCWSWCSPCCRAPRCRAVARRLGVARTVEPTRDRGRRRPARRAGRRPAAGAGAGRARSCAGSTSASCGCPAGPRSAWSCATARRSPRPARPGCASATSCWSSPRPAARQATEERIRAVDERGRLARWHAMDRDPDPRPRGPGGPDPGRRGRPSGWGMMERVSAPSVAAGPQGPAARP